MDIYAKQGTKVRCENVDSVVARWGGNSDPAGVLIVGQEYTVQSTEVHSSHTKVTLEEFPHLKFNSCHFE